MQYFFAPKVFLANHSEYFGTCSNHSWEPFGNRFNHSANVWRRFGTRSWAKNVSRSFANAPRIDSVEYPYTRGKGTEQSETLPNTCEMLMKPAISCRIAYWTYAVELPYYLRSRWMIAEPVYHYINSHTINISITNLVHLVLGNCNYIIIVSSMSLNEYSDYQYIQYKLSLFIKRHWISICASSISLNSIGLLLWCQSWKIFDACFAWFFYIRQESATFGKNRAAVSLITRRHYGFIL